MAQPQRAEDANAQIQSVVDNAITYYGAGSPTAIAAQVAAAQQEGNTAADVSTLNTAMMNSQVYQSPITAVGNYALNPAVSVLSDTSASLGVPWWAWAGGGLGLLLLVRR